MRARGVPRWLLQCAAMTVGITGIGALIHVSAAGGNDEDAMVLRGRQIVLESGCADCHGGMAGPQSEGWLAGVKGPEQEFKIGPCAFEKGALPCLITRPGNLTPDVETGTGRYTERQIFNALRFGLRPGETPDVEITSSTPGVGNFPAEPRYLAAPMPWSFFRHRSDEDLRAVAAYLKRGLRPVSNSVADSDHPPDFWADDVAKFVGPYPLAPFPTANEVMPAAGDRDLVLRGRSLVVSHACSGCHGGLDFPDAEGWVAGLKVEEPPFMIGACAFDPDAEPCHLTRPRNLTPDNATGLGRFSERQIFNALRFGLRPGETPDVEITSSIPGQGNFPANPKYLAPPMPWPAFRHMADADLWAIAAYLKRGLKPVNHRVEDSDGPPDFWASAYTVQIIGTYPAAAFPADREVQPAAQPVMQRR